jgi:NTP pyrophosphatase (non-canonical NTP hydrolase)
MNFKEYQEKSAATALYPNKGENYVYPTLGLVGEAGEVAEKVKKVIRDNGGKMDAARIQEIKKELGDVLWYVAALCRELELDMNEVAEENIQKLLSRKERNRLTGSGDNR